MIILDTTTKKLEIVLGGAVAANQLPVVLSFVDVTETTYRPTAYDTISNNTTAVPIAYAPASGMQRQIKFFTVKNEDTAAVLVIVRLNNNGTLRNIVEVTLAADSTLQYNDGEGFRVITTAGAIL